MTVIAVTELSLSYSEILTAIHMFEYHLIPEPHLQALVGLFGVESLLCMDELEEGVIGVLDVFYLVGTYEIDVAFVESE